MTLCHAAAKIANDVGRYDEAFEFAAAAGRYSGKDFDAVGLARRFEGLKKLFSAEFFAGRESSGDASKQPVFIVGMPRSGTTLTEQIIASHPQASGAGELGAFQVLAKSLGYLTPSLRNKDADEGEFARRVGALREKEIHAAAGEYLSTLRRVGGDGRRIVDKMPQNFQFAGLIALLFPNAKIIHCRRNPLDTCISCFMSHFVEGHDYSTDLEMLGSYYRQYAALMEHWRQALPIPIHEVRYRVLVADTEGEARKLIAFIGLEWDPACLRYYESKQPIFTNSRVQVRQPVYTSSVERWRRYERHIGPLKAALGDLVERA